MQIWPGAGPGPGPEPGPGEDDDGGGGGGGRILGQGQASNPRGSWEVVCPWKSHSELKCRMHARTILFSPSGPRIEIWTHSAIGFAKNFAPLLLKDNFKRLLNPKNPQRTLKIPLFLSSWAGIGLFI